MQGKFIRNWNAAIGILTKKQASATDVDRDSANYNIPLDIDGDCAGFSAAFLEYGSREDLLAFYNYVNFITSQSPEAIAKLLASKDSKESRFANQLFRFVTMVSTLQKNQLQRTPNQTAPKVSSNAKRINSQAQVQATAELLSNETSARNILEKLAVNEGMIMGAEGHAYAVYRTEAGWLVFDSNDKISTEPQSFSTIKDASRKLMSVVDSNAEDYALSKMSATQEVFHLMINIFVQFINIFRREKQMTTPVSLYATKVGFQKNSGALENTSAYKKNSSHQQILQRISGQTNAETLARRAINVDDGELLTKIVVAHNLDVNKSWQSWQGNESLKMRPLTAALQENNLQVLNALLKLNANPDLPDDKGNSTLMEAVALKNLEAAKCLLEHCANPDLTNKQGIRPLSLAIQKKDYEMTKLLLDNNADPDAKDPNGMTFLIYAITKNDEKAVELLLNYTTDVNLENKEGVTALAVAIMQNNATLVKKLLENTADPNFLDANGYTPLFYAVLSKNEDIVKLLLEHNADPLQLTSKGYTPLDLAIQKNDDNMIKALSSKNSEFIDKLVDAKESEKLDLPEQSPGIVAF